MHVFVFIVVPSVTFPPDPNFTFTVNESNPVTFECVATGIPPPSIYWLKNGTLLTDFMDYSSRVTLSNHTDPEEVETLDGIIYSVSRTLTLNNTVNADSGTYACVADNGNA